MKVLVSGATGFVGRSLTRRLWAEAVPTVAACRLPLAEALPWPVVAVGDIGPGTDWRAALHGVEQVVHLAARVHVMRDRASVSLAEFRRINVEGTLALARQAVQAGVRRFVFVSSIKVNGETSAPGRPCRPDDLPDPAEVGLRELAALTGMEVVIVRPPLVYGPGVKGNFRRLLQLAQYAVPLPLGAIDNRRSLVGIDNLVDFLLVCLAHPAAANGTFLVSDGQDVSTAQLYRRLVMMLGKSPHLPALPPALLRSVATVLGRRAAWQRLCGNLQVDTRLIRERLGWRPLFDLDQGLRRVVRHSSRQAQ
jgi:nucleoside-diphosphate-sugar epimerase